MSRGLAVPSSGIIDLVIGLTFVFGVAAALAQRRRDDAQHASSEVELVSHRIFLIAMGLPITRFTYAFHNALDLVATRSVERRGPIRLPRHQRFSAAKFHEMTPAIL
jgi:hypothetical protein